MEWNWPVHRNESNVGLFVSIIRSFVFTIILLTAVPVCSQFYEYGQDAGNIRWKQFESKHYQIIFPEGIDSLAMSFADKMEYFYPHQANQVEYSHQQMPVIIHNESSFSNGVFVWAPKRLEVFSNPDPNSYPQDWMTLLALHEGRHAFQVSKLNQGFSRGLSLIAGEQAVGAITGFLPMWYLEGDAVDTETRFSYSGRGRLPSFEMEMKAILLEQGKYPFSKAWLGSYKDNIPNYYKLGYMMVRYGKRTYGDAIWNDMEQFVAEKPWSVFPIYFSLRKYGINSKHTYYDEVMSFYYSHWNDGLSQRKISPAIKINNIQEKRYTNYRFPQWVDDSTVIVLKSGYDHIPEFVLLNNDGSEKRVFRPGYMNTGSFSYSKGKIIWDEWVSDIRWSNRNYSQIRVYDLEEKNLHKIESRTRYYAPSLSKDGKQIATIEQQTDHSFYLVIMDVEGNIEKKVRHPDNDFIQHPAWMENDSAIVLTANSEKGETLMMYSLERESWTELYHSGYNDISTPTVSLAKVYFGATNSGIDNIYSYDLSKHELHMVTSAKFGAFDASVTNDGRLLYADYRVHGYDVVWTKIVEETSFPFFSNGGRKEQIDSTPTEEEKQIVDGAASIDAGSYEIKPFRKISNAINVHSWLPLYFDYMNPEAALSFDELPVHPGISILTQNLLSTVTGMVGYEYKDKMHYLHSGFRLKGRIPVLEVSMDKGGHPLVNKKDESDVIATSANRLSLSSYVYVPLRFNTGRFISSAQPLLGYLYSSDVYPNEDRTGYKIGKNSFLFRIYVSSYLRMTRLDILPRLGVSGFISYTTCPFEYYNFGSNLYQGINVYSPGILKHQTFKISLRKQVQTGGNYLSWNTELNPRGITKPIYAKNLQAIKLDYTFPIAYPDLNIESILYIKRLRGNIWFDSVAGEGVSGQAEGITDALYITYGVDFLADLNILRMTFPFSPGIRVSYLPGSSEFIPELLFRIDVN